MIFVLDASAVMAALLNEPGGDYVHDVMKNAEVSAVNLSEVYVKLLERGVLMETASREIGKLDFRLRTFREAHAVFAASLRPLTKHLGLSFGDRACLAQGHMSGHPVLTADTDWAKLDLDPMLGIKIHLIRERRD